MKVCLAALTPRKYLAPDHGHSRYFLESFYTIKEWEIPILKNSDFFLIDSGAFTFMSDLSKQPDFDAYLDKYICFINENNIQHFFELDLDSVVGIKEVERLRSRLESETGKKSIPVWHKSRGKDYFIKMCKSYEYVSIGGIVSNEIKPAEYIYFKWFIDTAHYYGCKIHALGFTDPKGMYAYPFDSVDSTAWTLGARYGLLYHFNGRAISRISPNNLRIKRSISPKELDRWNCEEWVKFQRYADTHL